MRMLDSIEVANLPDGADAYLGYPGGKWPTFAALQARFRGRAHLLSLAIAADEEADGCDDEQGDLTTAEQAGWMKRTIARGVWRPVLYAAASNIPAALVALSLEGIGRLDVRLLSAHYTHEPHICGPDTCRYPGVPACDGTQWTDEAPGLNGTLIDESLLLPGFFGGALPPAPTAQWKEEPMLLGTGKSPVAIPTGTKQLHLVSGENRRVTIQFHGYPQPVTAELSWKTGSVYVPVPDPDKVHAAMIDVDGLTGHVALTFES